MKGPIQTFKAMSNTTRLGILLYLYGTSCHGAEMQDVRDHLEISKANLSQHAAVLKEAGLVYITPHGRTSTIHLEPTTWLSDTLEEIAE